MLLEFDPTLPLHELPLMNMQQLPDTADWGRSSHFDLACLCHKHSP
jgi:hypothetical protein